MLTLEQAKDILSQVLFQSNRYATIRVDAKWHRMFEREPEFGNILLKAGFGYNILYGTRLDTPPVTFVVTALEVMKPSDEMTTKETLDLAQAWLETRVRLKKIAEDNGYPDWIVPLPSQRDENYEEPDILDIVAAWEETDKTDEENDEENNDEVINH